MNGLFGAWNPPYLANRMCRTKGGASIASVHANGALRSSAHPMSASYGLAARGFGLLYDAA
jgi:hypothetical protein